MKIITSSKISQDRMSTRTLEINYPNFTDELWVGRRCVFPWFKMACPCRFSKNIGRVVWKYYRANRWECELDVNTHTSREEWTAPTSYQIHHFHLADTLINKYIAFYLWGIRKLVCGRRQKSVESRESGVVPKCRAARFQTPFSSPMMHIHCRYSVL